MTLPPSQFWQGRWFYEKHFNSYQIKARSSARRVRLSAVWVSLPLAPATTAPATPTWPPPPPSHSGDSVLTTAFVLSLLFPSFHLGICRSLTGAHSNPTPSTLRACSPWEMVAHAPPGARLAPRGPPVAPASQLSVSHEKLPLLLTPCRWPEPTIIVEDFKTHLSTID